MVSSKKLPRGIRNNNPLNIRIGNVWLGEVDHPTDRSFEQFKEMTYGLRAGFIILRRYIRRYHADTVREIVSRWAPRSENDTDAYVKSVAARLNIDPDTPIKYEDKKTMVALVDAMVRVECGCPVEEKLISKGYDIS